MNQSTQNTTADGVEVNENKLNQPESESGRVFDSRRLHQLESESSTSSATYDRAPDDCARPCAREERANGDYLAFKERQRWWAERGQQVLAPGKPSTKFYASERTALGCARKRCEDPKNKAWYLYGGRGIKVCAAWSGRGGFAAFVNHIGPKPTPQHTLDRIDNDRDYEPGNVRWATYKEQARNRRPRYSTKPRPAPLPPSAEVER